MTGFRLPATPPRSWGEIYRALREADRQNLKRNQDVEFDYGGARVILTSSNGKRWSIEVSDVGALSTSEIT